MKQRLIAALIFTVLMVAALWFPEHREPNNGLPLVHTALKAPPPPRWLAPCGIEPRNSPKWKERTA